MRTPNINSAYYAPGAVPRDSKSLQRFLQDEFKKIQNAVNAVALGHLDETHVSPAKPRTGDLRIADGTNWNPGSGSGMYFYQDSTWNFLTSASSGSSSLWISVKDHGAVGDGVTDDSTAINAAITAANALPNGGVVVFPPAIYLIGTALELKSNVILLMYGAKLKVKNSTNIHAIRISASASRVAVLGGEIDGNKANNASGGNGIWNDTTGAFTYAMIRDVNIHDCKANGIMLAGVDAANPSKYVTIDGCTLEDNDEAGISGNYLEEFTWGRNVAIDNGTHGIGLIGIGKYGTIIGNTASGSGTADNFTSYNNANRHLTVTGNVSRGGANNGIHFGGQDLIVSNNTVYDPTFHGIVIYSHSSATANNVSVTGNVIESAGKSGIWLDKTSEFAVTGNTVLNCTEHGVLLDGTNTNGTVTGNTAKGNGADGIRLQACDQVIVNGNTSIGNTSDGIQLADSTDCSVTGNNCKDNATPFNETGTSDWNLIASNHFRGNTSDVPAVVGANTQWRNNLNGATNSVTAAATTTLPVYTDYITILGTTNITSITASWNRRVVTLRFDDVLTFTDGSNLKLAGNFVTTNNDTITLLCDGTDWYEIARSVN